MCFWDDVYFFHINADVAYMCQFEFRFNTQFCCGKKKNNNNMLDVLVQLKHNTANIISV